MSKKKLKSKKSKSALVSVVMGSETDFPIMKAAVEILEELKVPVEVKIVSAHRTPEAMVEYALKVRDRGLQIVIAGAGGAAHLPGMIASLTTLPVIGVPVLVGSMKGLDALLSIAQMPKGIPVATVAVDNAYNAGLLAARILSLNSTEITQALEKYRLQQKTKVKKMNRNILNRTKAR